MENRSKIEQKSTVFDGFRPFLVSSEPFGRGFLPAHTQLGRLRFEQGAYAEAAQLFAKAVGDPEAGKRLEIR